MMKAVFFVALVVIGLLFQGVQVATVDAADLRTMAVYTMSNAAPDNQVVARYRDVSGLLVQAGSFSADGAGTGAGLGNQQGIVFAQRGTVQYLLTINAGSDELASFRVDAYALVRRHVVPSGGDGPVSLTAFNDRVCVVHNDGMVACFTLSDDGMLTPLGSASIGAGKGPAQIAFVHNTGQVLAITAKTTNEIITLPVNTTTGALGAPIMFASAGQTPFGFCVWGIYKNLLAVSNAEGGVAGATTVSSYIVAPNGVVTLRSPRVPSGQSAACWLVCSKSGKYAFVANTPSGTISTYNLDTSNGFISLKAGAAATLPTGGVSDMALTKDGKYLYARHGATLAVFLVGDLTGTVSYHSSNILNVTAFTGGIAAQ